MFSGTTLLPLKPFSPVFLYHAAFSDVPAALGGAVHNVTPDNMYRQITWLKQYYDIVHVDALFDAPYGAGRCAITFDDAYLSVFKEALPVLESLNAPATVFVNATTLDGQIFWRDKIRLILARNLANEFVTWAQDFCTEKGITKEKFYGSTKKHHVNSYELAGLIDQFLQLHPGVLVNVNNYCAGTVGDLVRSPLIRYGNHTYSHFVLSSLSKEQQRDEIVKNQDRLSALIEPEYLSHVFSIPFGGVDTVNADTFEILKARGYKGALLSRSRFNRAGKSAPHMLHGLPVLERIMPEDRWPAFMHQMRKTGLKALIGR